MDIASVASSAYQSLSSGMRINSAADDAAGLAIANKMDSQTRGMEQNVDNIGSMSDLTKTAEGALGSIQDSLGRIRELAVQASNGILTDSDRSVIQGEVDQLLQGIQETAVNTEYNTMKLLDGSFANRQTAMNPDGSGMEVSIASAALDNLGIEGFNVTGSFSIEAIDKAMEMVGESRSELGSVQNAFEYATSNTENAIQNLTASKSQIEDADMAQQISNLKREQVLQQYQIFTQQAKEDQQRNELGIMQSFDATL